MDIEIIINQQNARKTWGIVTTSNTLATLLAPAPLKEFPSFSSRLEHGIRIDTSNPKVDKRELTLEIQMVANSIEDFYDKHNRFIAELQQGEFELVLSDNPSVGYHLIYQSCSTYTQFCRGIATLSLKVIEPNPTIRDVKYSPLT